jgi:hypothetical protein
MLSIARYLLSVLVLAVIMQCAFLVLVINITWKEVLDSHHKNNSIFQDEARAGIYGSPMIVRGSDHLQVVILGVSNTVRALRPEQLQPLLGIPVHNIGMGGQRFRAFDQMVELLYRQTPKEKRRNYVFVIAPSYPLIADMKENMGGKRSSVDEEMLRYGIFVETPQGIIPRVSDARLSSALQAVWPFMAPQAIYTVTLQTLLPKVVWSYIIKAVPFTNEETNTITFTPEQNKARIDFYNTEVIDTTGAYTFDHLIRAADRISAEGGQLVIIDLPSATWLQKATPLYAAYQQLKKPYYARLQKQKNIRFLELQDGFANEDFYDGIHVRARISSKIATLAAIPIGQALDALNKSH